MSVPMAGLGKCPLHVGLTAYVSSLFLYDLLQNGLIQVIYLCLFFKARKICITSTEGSTLVFPVRRSMKCRIDGGLSQS